MNPGGIKLWLNIKKHLQAIGQEQQYIWPSSLPFSLAAHIYYGPPIGIFGFFRGRRSVFTGEVA